MQCGAPRSPAQRTARRSLQIAAAALAQDEIEDCPKRINLELKVALQIAHGIDEHFHDLLGVKRRIALSERRGDMVIGYVKEHAQVLSVPRRPDRGRLLRGGACHHIAQNDCLARGPKWRRWIRRQRSRFTAMTKQLGKIRVRHVQARDLSARSRHGPVIAIVIPGVWILTKSVVPSGEKQAPANSLMLVLASL